VPTNPHSTPTHGGSDPSTLTSDTVRAIPASAFVIDDEGGICQIIAMTLASLGIKAQSYASAQQAVAGLERGHPDIVFLDIALKGSDAIDVIRALGTDGYGGIVQLMSGADALLLDDVCRVGERHGLDMRPPLVKPFRAAEIRQAVTAGSPGGSLERPPTVSSALRLSLDEALVNRWLELWYQPKIDLRANALAGAEGLIRCRHPQYGLLSPGTFLPEASESGLTALTEYVVATALRDWAVLADAGTNIRIAVNTSIGALTNLNLPTLVREHRPRTETWPGLILEVTEDQVIDDVALAHEIATQLRIYGIALSIDDFGEGYSSFARLRELPFHELKLDTSFVQGCADDTTKAGICQSIIDLAHHFGAVAVAEGVESEFDLAAVRGMGCDIAQGYLFAQPMPKSELISVVGEWVSARRAWFT
jgi:EAL domain-containing protein (putative c-di-GMP-specific phosphodiesterase class I)